MSKFIRYFRFYGFGEAGVDLDLCLRIPMIPRVDFRGQSIDETKIEVFYMTPDKHWFYESEPGVYVEEHRNEVRDCAIRVGLFPLPPELQNDEDRAAYTELRANNDKMLGITSDSPSSADDSAKSLDATPGRESTPAELRAKGFVPMTVDQMMDKWDYGRDPLRILADKAVHDGHIHDDWEVITPKKRPQLWVRLKLYN